MKKVGIITFSHSYNHGAVLQAFALKTAIESLGYEVCVIDYTLKSDYAMYDPSIFSAGIFNFPIKLAMYHTNKRRAKAFESFRHLYLGLTSRMYFDGDDLSELNDSFDIFVAGSDQIWNLRFIGIVKDFFLEFASNYKVRIAYAPSIGDSYEEIRLNSEIIRNYLMAFHAVSAREQKGALILSEILDRQVPVVLDPTFLIDPGIYEKISSPIKSDKYIFAYFVGKADNVCVREIAKRKKLKIKYQAASILFHAENVFQYGPLEFLGYIASAEYVITSSFHGTIFSILFKKKFCVCNLAENDERVRSLLIKLNLTSRIYHEGFDIDADINYDEVNRLLFKERDKSLKFLLNALE